MSRGHRFTAEGIQVRVHLVMLLVVLALAAVVGALGRLVREDTPGPAPIPDSTQHRESWRWGLTEIVLQADLIEFRQPGRTVRVADDGYFSVAHLGERPLLGSDLTGDGTADLLVVEEWGACYPVARLRLFQLEPTPRQLWRSDPLPYCSIRELPGEEGVRVLASESASGSVLSIHKVGHPYVVHRVTGRGLEVDFRAREPIYWRVRGRGAEVLAGWGERGETFFPVMGITGLSSNLLAMVYAGHATEARSQLNQVWPADYPLKWREHYWRLVRKAVEASDHRETLLRLNHPWPK